MTPGSVRNVTVAIPARLENVALAGVAVRALSGYELFSSAEALLIELAVCEALNNIILHALGDKNNESIELCISLYPDRVVFIIYDCGEEMQGGYGDHHHDSSDIMATSGRGVAIISDIMDEVRYERKDEKNILILEKRVARGAHPTTP